MKNPNGVKLTSGNYYLTESWDPEDVLLPDEVLTFTDNVKDAEMSPLLFSKDTNCTVLAKVKILRKPTLTLTVGCSNSGKSTWAATVDASIVNRDDTRENLFGKDYVMSKVKESMVTRVNRDRAHLAMKLGSDIIISDTNLNPWVRESWKDFAEMYNMDYVEKFFDTPLEECLRRNALRERKVPERVIMNQHEKAIEYAKES